MNATNGGTRSEPRSRSNTTLLSGVAVVALRGRRLRAEGHDERLLVDRADVHHRVLRLVQADVDQREPAVEVRLDRLKILPPPVS